MCDRSMVMKAAWLRYRRGPRLSIPFDGVAFASALRIEWGFAALARSRTMGGSI